MVLIKVLSSDAFQEWFNDLKDFKAVKAIKARIDRIKIGNFGDWSKIEGVKNMFELRIDVSKGYRVYYTKQGNTVVILLCGGFEDTQNKNIREAEHILNNLKFKEE
jgi:putative addiction module killer protein